MTSDDDDAVGYGRPPRTNQFKAGHSGNPKGRPRKSRAIGQVVRDAAAERVVVTENGRRRRVSKAQASAKQLANKSASGDLRATKMLFDMSRAAEAEEAAAPLTPEQLSQADSLIAESLIARIKSYGAE